MRTDLEIINESLTAAAQARVPRGSSAGGRFAKSGGGGSSVTTVRLNAPSSGNSGSPDFSKMTRTQAVAHLRANGHTGPVSYNMTKLRGMAKDKTTSPTPKVTSGSMPGPSGKTQTAGGAKISKADAAAKMFGTGSPQHQRAKATESGVARGPEGSPRAKQHDKWLAKRDEIVAKQAASKDSEIAQDYRGSGQPRYMAVDRVEKRHKSQLADHDARNKPADNPVRPESFRDKPRVRSDMNDHIRDSQSEHGTTTNGQSVDRSQLAAGLRTARGEQSNTVTVKLDYEMSIPKDLAEDALATDDMHWN